MKTRSRPLFVFQFFENVLHKVKTSGRHLSFNVICRSRLGHTIKINLKTFRAVNPKIGSNLYFYLGLTYPSHFMYDFSKKLFFMLYSIIGQNFIVSLLLLLEILSNMCIVLTFCPLCNVIIFEINPYSTRDDCLLKFGSKFGNVV